MRTPNAERRYLALLVIYHDVVGLHISVHNAFAMAEVQGFQELKDVVPNIIIDESRVQGSEVGVVDVFEDQTRRLALAVTNNIQQRNDVWSTRQILQDLDLPLYLLLLDRLQDFDDAFLVVDDVDPFENFGVFPSTCPQSA